MLPEDLEDELHGLVLAVLPTKRDLEQALTRAFDHVVREYRLTNVRVTEGEHVIDAVWWETGRSPVVRDVLDELQERELIGPAWFDELRRAAPGRSDEIDELQVRIEAALARGKSAPPPSDPTPDPDVDPDPDADTDPSVPAGAYVPDTVEGPAFPWAWAVAAGAIGLVAVVVVVVAARSGWLAGDPGGAPGDETGAADTDPDTLARRDTDADSAGLRRQPPDDDNVLASFDGAWVVKMIRTCDGAPRGQAALVVDTAAVATIARPEPPGATCTWADAEGAAWREARREDGVVVLRPVPPPTVRRLESSDVRPVPVEGRRPTRIELSPLPGFSASPTRREVDLGLVPIPPLRRISLQPIDAERLSDMVKAQDVGVVREDSMFKGPAGQVVRASTILSNRPVFEVIDAADPRALSTRVGSREVPLRRVDDGLVLVGGGTCDGAPVLTPGKTVAGLCRMKGSGVHVAPIGAAKVADALKAEDVVVFLVE